MYKKTEYLCVMLFGAALYGIIEVMWRGYTHPSMVVTGGVCFLLIHLINCSLPREKRIIKYLLCSASVTGVEFAVGVVVNIMLGLGVWDYSGEPFNILGQVCLKFTLAWLVLSVPACYLSDMARAFFQFLEKKEQGDSTNSEKMAKL
ncbi:MAG: hypothetical protein E7628_06600 [Ruminococcaceae bacterium]|nr:hypothetical protein [Oscillospiraceae bacterium]